MEIFPASTAAATTAAVGADPRSLARRTAARGITTPRVVGLA